MNFSNNPEGDQVKEATIRLARLDDLDDLVELLQILFSLEDDFDFDPARQRRGLAMMLEHDGATVLVAESKNRVIGMCSGQLTISTAEGGVALLVEDVVVIEAWQGQGVGRKLVKSLEKWAGDRKIVRLQLLADRNNKTALTFYTTVGWQATELICLRKRMPAGTF